LTAASVNRDYPVPGRGDGAKALAYIFRVCKKLFNRAMNGFLLYCMPTVYQLGTLMRRMPWTGTTT
jgi:hypothetical protein